MGARSASAINLGAQLSPGSATLFGHCCSAAWPEETVMFGRPLRIASRRSQGSQANRLAVGTSVSAGLKDCSDTNSISRIPFVRRAPQHYKKQQRQSVQANASIESTGKKIFPRAQELTELPLFPLPLVLFPGQVLPLKVFEYRYRIMMHSLLQTDLKFGVVCATEGTGTAAAVGCVAEVVKHERHSEDRFTLVSRGQQRFRVHSLVRSRPYVIARVEWLEDRPSAEPAPGEDPETLAQEVEGLMKDVIRLSNKVRQSHKNKESEDLRKQAFPTPFSFWVASTFEGAPQEQQALLELLDTSERLKRERTTLRNTLNYLTAATAVREAFRSSPSTDSDDDPPEAPPTGGPD